jgi:hypothetical protein
MAIKEADMKSKRTHWLLAGLAVICAAAFTWWWTPGWPDFASDPSAQAQVIVRVDRDYGVRTGDLVPVDVYVRLQPPGSRLDVSTLSVEGDFELASPPKVEQKSLKDGSSVYHLRIGVQSFRVQPAVVLHATISWVAGETRSHLAIPELTVHTSKTWDGRDKMQEGDDPRVSVFWYAWRYAVPLALASFLFVVLCVRAVRNYWRNRPKPQVDVAYNRAAELFERIEQGNCTREQHLELDGIIRERFAIGPIPAAQLDTGLLGASVVECLRLNAVAIYGDKGLDATGIAAIRESGSHVLKAWTEKAKPVSER